jgi:MOSC domain-containing protein YiiM
MSGNGAVGILRRINVNPRGGVPKGAVPSAVISADGVAGDRQRNRRFHGGPARAVSLFSKEVIDRLAAEGHPIAPGSTGENLTLAGLPWDAIGVGDRLLIAGRALLEVTSFATPCKTIAGSFLAGKSVRISQKLHPGESRLYARVIAPGEVREGDPVLLLAG